MWVGRSWKVVTIGGVPVRVDTSWLFMTGLIVWILWAQASSIGIPDSVALAAAVFSVVLFAGSILLHEGAHAAMCRLRDIHVESITLVGWGGLTSAYAEEKGPKVEFLVAIVGPLTSALLGLAMIAAGRALPEATALAGAFRYMGLINLWLALLNILPGYPMDGGRVLRAVVLGSTKNRITAARVAGWSGQVTGAAMIAFGFLTTTGSLRAPIGGPFMILIGFMLIGASRGSENRERLSSLLRGAHVRDAMSPPPTPIPAGITLADALDRFLRGHEDKTFPVVDDRRLVGLLTFAGAARVGQHEPLRPVRDAMAPVGEIRVMQAGEPLDRAAHHLAGGGTALVLQDRELVGALTVEDISRWAMARVGHGNGHAPGSPPAPPAPVGGDAHVPPRPDV